MHPIVILNKELERIIETSFIGQSKISNRVVIRCKLDTKELCTGQKVTEELKDLISRELNINRPNEWKRIAPRFPQIIDYTRYPVVIIDSISLVYDEETKELYIYKFRNPLQISIIESLENGSQMEDNCKTEYHLEVSFLLDERVKKDYDFIDYNTVESVLGYI